MQKIVLLFWFLILAYVISAYSQDKLNIAVAEFEGQNVSAMDTKIVTYCFITALVKSDKYDVLARKDMKAILSGHGLQTIDCTTRECAVKIGKVLNVQNMVIGSINKLADTYLITADIIDVKTGNIKKSEEVEAGSFSELRGKTEYLAEILVKDIPGIKGEPGIKKKPKKKVRHESITRRPRRRRRTAERRRIYEGYNKFGIGINYPGISFKWFLASKLCIEPKAQFGKDILVIGIRPGYYFNRRSAVLCYTGLEFDYFTYKFEVSEGSGVLIQPFIGLECFALNNFSFQFDIGPTFLSLQDKNYDISLSDVDIVGNIGINYYFGNAMLLF